MGHAPPRFQSLWAAGLFEDIYVATATNICPFKNSPLLSFSKLTCTQKFYWTENSWFFIAITWRTDNLNWNFLLWVQGQGLEWGFIYYMSKSVSLFSSSNTYTIISLDLELPRISSFVTGVTNVSLVFPNWNRNNLGIFEQMCSVTGECF